MIPEILIMAFQVASGKKVSLVRICNYRVQYSTTNQTLKNILIYTFIYFVYQIRIGNVRNCRKYHDFLEQLTCTTPIPSFFFINLFFYRRNP